MTTLQEQARALGDPTRHEIFRLVAGAGRPVGVAELTDHFGFNHNAIRQHLAKLVAAGLVVEGQAPPSGPGRRRLEYVVDPAADGRWGTAGPYQRLSELLLEIIGTGATPVEVGRRAAHVFRVPRPSGDVVADVATSMRRQGFEPEVRAARRGAEIVLRVCPFAGTARLDRSTVCSLHLGIAEGLVSGSDVAVRELVAHDPDRADCRLRLVHDPGAVEREPDPASLTLRGRPSRHRAAGAPGDPPGHP